MNKQRVKTKSEKKNHNQVEGWAAWSEMAAVWPAIPDIVLEDAGNTLAFLEHEEQGDIV